MRWSGRWCFVSRRILCCTLLLWLVTLHAQTTYVRDADGRVVAATQSNGTSVQYSYDALGHIGPVSAPLSADQLAIFAFMPTHGVAGAEVILEGQGFSNSVANDNVSFHGTAATVLSASATQLVVSVPNGATTGPISVTVSGQTATTATSFVIDDTGAPPSITQVSPLVVAAGGTVTVTGTYLNPIASGTTVQMGGVDMLTGLSQSDTQVQYTVPSNAVSGHVTVNTPYGSATSALPVTVLPSSLVSELNGAPTSYLVANGNAVSFSTGAAGHSGVLTFDAPPGGNDELTLNGITITGSSNAQINVNVYGPTGTVVISTPCYTTTPGATCRIALWNLASGTYTAVVSPVDTSSIIGFNAFVEPDVIGPSLAANTPTAVNLATGQLARFTFHANAGDTYALRLSGVNTIPTNQTMTAYVYSPLSTTITVSNYYTSFAVTSSSTINLSNLPASGTYTVVVFTNGIPGSGQLTLVSGVTGTVTKGGVAQSYSTGASGQNAYLTFTANAGDNLEFTLSNISVTGGSDQLGVSIYNAAGTQITSSSCSGTSPGSDCRIFLWNMAAGTYSVVVSPTSGSVMTFNALLQPDIVGPALTANTPVDISLGTGQVERLTFNATAGETLALNLSGVSTTPAGQYLYVVVYRPDVGTITPTGDYTYFDTTSSQTVNLTNLPVSGTYTVVVDSTDGVPASGQLTLIPGVTGTVTNGGAAQSYSTGASGQNTYLTFTANAGDNLEFTLSNISVTGGSDQLGVSIYNAAGTQINSSSCYGTSPGSDCRIFLWNMAAGTYSVIVSPASGGTMTFNALLQPDILGPVLTANTPAAISLNTGQVERLTFNATAGETLALNLSGVSTTPAGQDLYVVVYRPDVGTITPTDDYTYFDTTSSQILNLTNLPVSGTYTVVVDSTVGVPASAQLTLVPGVTGTVPGNGTSQNYTANAPGENAYLTFAANAGDNLEFTLSNISVTGGSSQLGVTIYNAAGAQISSSSCAGSNPGSDCRIFLWNMAAGTYSVVVSPAGGGIMTFNALLQPDIVGPALTANTPTTVSLSTGQVERLTFSATAGETVTLNLSGVSTTPTGQDMYVVIFRPDVGTITPNNEYTYFVTASSQSLSLPNLPVGGTYTIVVDSTVGVPASGQLTLTTQ